MKIVSDDGRFEVEISGKEVDVKFHLQDFEGNFTVKEFPQKVKDLRNSLEGIVNKADFIIGLIKRELQGD